MKKWFLIFIITLVALGCASGPAQKTCDWCVTPPQAADAFYGVGESNQRIPALAKATAAGLARAQIAFNISVKVKALLRFHLEESGIGTDAEVTAYSELVSKQISDQTLNGAGIKDTYRRDKGGITTFFILIEYPIGAARQMATDLARQTLKREEALYNKYRAEQGMERLDQEIEANLTTAQ